MTSAVIARPARGRPAGWALDIAARTWFAAMVVGQGLFLAYIAAFYFPSTLTGHFEAWKRNHMLLTGYVPGDTVGNLSFGLHVLLAGLVTFGGVLQLIPQIRTRAPAVHRWIGRLFLASAMAASLAGLYGVWVRGATTDLSNGLAISLDGVLILGFGVQAWRLALRRQFAAHRRWALRAFMVTNGVFFLRSGVVAYGLLSAAAGPVLPSMGKFFDAWNYGCYLAPLAALELYFAARREAWPRAGLAATTVILALTAFLGAGAVAAWFAMYAPILAGA